MCTIEDDLWEEIVSKYLPTSDAAVLPKKEQQELALRLQEWTAGLNRRYRKEEWEIHYEGKLFLGAVRWQEVDVWLSNPKAGLVLAVDPKHFQSKKSLEKNWKNGYNDLVAFATNLHERFPLCTIGGVIVFPEWAAQVRDLRQMYSICGKSIPRKEPLNAYGKFEGLAIVLYDSRGQLVWPFEEDSPLRADAAFRILATAVFSRTVGLV
jgi:hypothetical protein